MVARGEVVRRMNSKQNKTINQQSDIYFTRRTFILISGKFHPDAQDSKSAVIGKGAGDAQSLKQGRKINTFAERASCWSLSINRGCQILPWETYWKYHH